MIWRKLEFLTRIAWLSLSLEIEADAASAREDAKIKLIRTPVWKFLNRKDEKLRSSHQHQTSRASPSATPVSLDATTVETMANKSSYNTSFEPQQVIQPIYTGGSVALDNSGRILATCLGEDALITDLNTGRQLAKIEGVSFGSFPHLDNDCQ